jgi:hypothetical protein
MLIRLMDQINRLGASILILMKRTTRTQLFTESVADTFRISIYVYMAEKNKAIFVRISSV